jgi:hypothetical protein
MNKFSRWIRSKQGLATLGGVVVLALIVAVVGSQLGWWGGPGTAGLVTTPTWPDPAGGWTYMPTGNETDGKWLTTVTGGTASFTGNVITLWIALGGDKTSFQVGFFDGDAGNGSYWDNQAVPTTYTLYADPLRDGSGKTVVATWTSDQMADNQWTDFTVNTGVDAQAPSGHYMYRLEATYDPAVWGYQRFKVRSSGYIGTGKTGMEDGGLPLNGAWGSTKSRSILNPQYQSYSNPGPSNYNGTWQFYFEVPVQGKTIDIYDGDFDRGTSATVASDTDDPNYEGKPSWAGPGTVNERAGGAGAPADNDPNAYARRDPPVQYTLVDPSGQPIWTDDNPSGTEEWEMFRLSSDPAQNPDLFVNEVKPGSYLLEIQGLDLNNTVWLKTNFCLSAAQEGCGPPEWPEASCPRTIGYWKNNTAKLLIQNKTNGVQESVESVHKALRFIALASPLYRHGINIARPVAIADPGVILDDNEAYTILMRGAQQAPYPGDTNSMLARALQQNLATWLNLASGKIGKYTWVTLTNAGGTGVFEGTVWDALQTAQAIMLNPNATAQELEQAKDIGDLINNGLLGEDAANSVCTDYVQQIKPEKQPPTKDKLPKAPKTEPPGQVPPAPAPVCTAGNTYNVENPTNDPYYSVKFNFASGTEVKDGGSDVFEYSLPKDVVAAMTQMKVTAKAATDEYAATLVCDFTDATGCDAVFSPDHLFGYQFLGAVENADGSLTLRFQVWVFGTNALSHTAFELPAGTMAVVGSTYTSQSCVAP